MPDTDDYETRNAPASPASWSEAFAALPAEAPAAGGWARLQSRLPAAAATMPRARRRWTLWLATAAVLALALAIPLRMQPPSGTDAAAAMRASTASTSTSAVVAVAPAITTPLVADPRPIPLPVASRKAPSRQNRIEPVQRPIRTAAEPAGTTRLATADAPAQHVESLHAESAQLEQLLAEVRDDRVASATSVALSSDLDDRIAGIDDALAQPGLDAADRDRLWQQRVDALQQLVGIETTNRLLSARGQQFNASLVSID